MLIKRQKAVFENAKGRISECDMRPFDIQHVAFYLKKTYFSVVFPATFIISDALFQIDKTTRKISVAIT